MVTKKKKLVVECGYYYEMEVEDDGFRVMTPGFDSYDLSSLGNVICITNNMNDRFPFLPSNSIRNDERYCYFGLRAASNNIFMSRIRDRFLRSVFEIGRCSRKSLVALDVLKKVGAGSMFKIDIERGRFFDRFYNVAQPMGLAKEYPGRDDEIKKTAKKMAENGSYGDRKLEDFLDPDFMMDFSKSDCGWGVFDEKFSYGDGVGSFFIDFEVGIGEKDVAVFNTLLELIEKNVLKLDKVSICGESDLDLLHTSSGEMNLMRIIFSILETVKDNSLIFIDEPEVSLHPNWQMEFMGLVDEALRGYTGCHVIIATHSHFLISNLEPDNSEVISLGLDGKGNILVNPIAVNPYGWSPEQVLYRVFGVTSFRNQYFEADLRIVISAVRKDLYHTDDLLPALKRLSGFNIEASDPLFDVIEKAKLKSNYYAEGDL